MNEARFKIVFDGELLPEMSLDTVKDNLARLFKSDRARIEQLFGRRAVVLKRDLSATEVDKYVVALTRAGAHVRMEADQAASLSLVDTDEHRPAATVNAMTDARMQCPKCAHEQPQAIECAACGIVIDKYVARQAQLAESAPPQPPSSPGSAEPSPYTPPQAPVGEPLPEVGDLKVFSLEGRIGRLRYLAWSLVLMLAGAGLFGIAAIGLGIDQTLGAILMIAASIALMVVAVQIGVQRLHDIDWSGWLLLLNLIPLVGSVFALLMLLVPGTPGANRYGPPPPANSTAVKVLAGLWLIPIAALVLALLFGGVAALSGLGDDLGLPGSYDMPATQEKPSNPYGEE
ncbi:DUF805 domain-containing protein [Pseudomonas cavernae]|uniref:DUF805 domain-containing protein n=1 Tax=Pseudomonas cavernae TaxID=2320867 RepID=A0A385YXD7_9PSED|nr:DUF805 domain-containing protein [Pseudomonas cavernae]AYC31356.1 DUF805 domain-containing protein [Pseudomonas cavernae]